MARNRVIVIEDAAERQRRASRDAWSEQLKAISKMPYPGGPLTVPAEIVTPLMLEWLDIEDEVDIASVTRDVARES